MKPRLTIGCDGRAAPSSGAQDSAPFEPTHEQPAPVLRPRGVWVADFTDLAGNPQLQIIDSQHRLIQMVPLLPEPDHDWDEIVARAWRVLDLHEPESEVRPERPPLAIVR
jgi:hypothetical protein